MQGDGRDAQGSLAAVQGPTPGRRRRARGMVLALVAAHAAGALLAAGAGASGSAQGPPAGPTSPPFTQCPAIGLDASCEYLIDVTSTSVRPIVVQDATQHFYDGEDDVTVAVQNDTASPLGSVHIGVAESADQLFAFDGDGLCWGGISPRPAECPFSPLTYDGPDTTLSPEPPDAGTVFFNTPLQPGQYTYFALEARRSGAIVAGAVNVLVTTTLESLSTHEPGDELSAPAPAPSVTRPRSQDSTRLKRPAPSNTSCTRTPTARKSSNGSGKSRSQPVS
jgi:hypothetical protein